MALEWNAGGSLDCRLESAVCSLAADLLGRWWIGKEALQTRHLSDLLQTGKSRELHDTQIKSHLCVFAKIRGQCFVVKLFRHLRHRRPILGLALKQILRRFVSLGPVMHRVPPRMITLT